MAETSPITNRYKLLQKSDCNNIPSDQISPLQSELDSLYEELISKPILSVGDALDKLAFADHCLLIEHDVKEASNLIREVSAALFVLFLTGTTIVNTSESHTRHWFDDPNS
jgi:hypothetical protein